MMKIIFLGLFIIFLSGCSSTIRQGSYGYYHSIGNHPYQSIGYYETIVDEDGYVNRILLNKSRVKKINKDKYYIEIIIRTGR